MTGLVHLRLALSLVRNFTKWVIAVSIMIEVNDCVVFATPHVLGEGAAICPGCLLALQHRHDFHRSTGVLSWNTWSPWLQPPPLSPPPSGMPVSCTDRLGLCEKNVSGVPSRLYGCTDVGTHLKRMVCSLRH